MIEKNIDKKLANRINYQIRYKRCSKGKFGRGVQTYEGGSISACGYGLGGGGVQIREGSKYTVTPAQNVRDFW